MIGIYKITSPSEAVYIGQTWDIEGRKDNYKVLKCKGQPKLYNSLKKYGWENHMFEIVHELPVDISQEILDNYEILYWEQYKDCGYEMMNIKEPGRGGKHSKETCELIRSKLIGRKMSEETKKKLYTPERLEKIKETKKNNPYKHTEETKQKIGLSKIGKSFNLGSKRTDETKEKMRKAKLGTKQTKERIEKFRQSRIGKGGVSIICLNDNKIFNSITEAAKYYNIKSSSIDNILSGRAKKTKNLLTFKYYNIGNS